MIKAAVVGVGYLGKFHAQKYSKSESAELVAVVDTNADRAQKVAEECGCLALTDYKKLVDLGVECVSVVSSTSTHFEVASWLLENGFDVLVEKPMTVKVDEAHKLIALAKKHKRVLQVGHLERFNPAFRAMKGLIEKPAFFEARRISPFSGRGADVDVVLDLMIHDIDIISHLVGAPLVQVDAVGVPVLTQTVDIANVRLTFASGAVANVTASRAAFKSERSIRVFQPNLYIFLDYEKKKLKAYRKEEAKAPGMLPEIKVFEQDVEERDALFDEIESFINSCETREMPVVSGEDGVKALELAERIHQAIRESAAKMAHYVSPDYNPPRQKTAEEISGRS